MAPCPPNQNFAELQSFLHPDSFVIGPAIAEKFNDIERDAGCKHGGVEHQNQKMYFDFLLNSSKFQTGFTLKIYLCNASHPKCCCHSQHAYV